MHFLITKSVRELCLRTTMFLVFYGMINVCDARKISRPPLIEERQPKIHNRPTHCPFGNQSYEIEERWRPNLQPFGVYYCIRCECVAVQKKNRKVAKVRCKNIKNDCPKPNCEDPVLLSERCCKTCPGEDYADLEEDLAVRKLENDEDDLIKEYSVQLNGKGLKPNVQTNINGKGYLYFSKRNLHYTLHISGTERPTYIRFTDEEGNILEEYEIDSSTQNANSTKISGIWRNVPKVYRAMLRKAKLYLAVSVEKGSDASSIIAGKVIKNDLSHPEALLNSDLLSLKETANGNGVAVVTAVPINVHEDNSQSKKKYVNDENSQNNLIGEPSLKCYYEGAIYEDGSQWKAQHDDCEMCFCQRGRVKCEQELCPKLSCINQTKVGSCCPICTDQIESSNISISSTKGCYFEGDKKFHIAGHRWHPYLPPFGFDKCSLCTCSAESLTIQCERKTTCPALTCPEQEAYRENAMDCCKRCPNVLPVRVIVSVDQMGDQRSIGGSIKSPNELMAAGGCRFRGRVYINGDEWHPTVQPFGEVKCVKCRCKDGNHKCKRIVCPKITACSIVINKNNECCPICADDSDDMMMKNQPQVVHNRKRGKNQRRNKGRRALHLSQTRTSAAIQ